MTFYEGSLAPASNRAHWIVDIDAEDDLTGVAFDWTTATDIVVSARDVVTNDELLAGSLVDGRVTLSATAGRITWTFAPEDMASLVPGTYAVGLAYKAAGIVTTLIAGTVQVVEGVAQI